MKIAITGKMCSGKSTISRIIQDLDPRYEIFSYGKKVKEVASDLFGMDPQVKDRSLLINVATKMREINPNVWSNYVTKQTQNKEYCLIDDLRFQNELDELIKNDWIIIQLIISEEEQNKRIKKLYPNTYKDHIINKSHLSEKNELNYPEKIPHLTLNTDKLTKEEIKEILKDYIRS